VDEVRERWAGRVLLLRIWLLKKGYILAASCGPAWPTTVSSAIEEERKVHWRFFIH